MKPRPTPRFLFDEVGFRADMEEFHAHLRAQPRPGLAKPVSDIDFDVATERSDGWAFEKGE